MIIPRSRYSSRVLIDSSAFYALSDERSSDYARSVSTRAELVRQHRQLCTTNFVVAETHALLLSRHGRDLAARVLEEIDSSPMRIIRVRFADEERAREIIFTHDDKDYSLTDATSFAVM